MSYSKGIHSSRLYFPKDGSVKVHQSAEDPTVWLVNNRQVDKNCPAEHLDNPWGCTRPAVDEVVGGDLKTTWIRSKGLLAAYDFTVDEMTLILDEVLLAKPNICTGLEYSGPRGGRNAANWAGWDTTFSPVFTAAARRSNCPSARGFERWRGACVTYFPDAVMNAVTAIMAEMLAGRRPLPDARLLIVARKAAVEAEAARRSAAAEERRQRITCGKPLPYPDAHNNWRYVGKCWAGVDKFGNVLDVVRMSDNDEYSSGISFQQYRKAAREELARFGVVVSGIVENLEGRYLFLACNRDAELIGQPQLGVY